MGLTFARGLRSILRHDPDVVLIGEIRDAETARIAVQASLTGHLVFSTLHTNDAPSAVTRLLDMGVEPYLVASSVEGILAQRLVRVLCPTCRRPVTDDERRELRAVGWPVNGEMLYQAVGCSECRYTRYVGRHAVSELLRLNDDVRRMITGTCSSTAIRDVASAHGWQPLRQDGWRLVRAGGTTVSEVLRVSREGPVCDLPKSQTETEDTEDGKRKNAANQDGAPAGSAGVSCCANGAGSEPKQTE